MVIPIYRSSKSHQTLVSGLHSTLHYKLAQSECNFFRRSSHVLDTGWVVGPTCMKGKLIMFLVNLVLKDLTDPTATPHSLSVWRATHLTLVWWCLVVLWRCSYGRLWLLVCQHWWSSLCQCPLLASWFFYKLHRTRPTTLNTLRK